MNRNLNTSRTSLLLMLPFLLLNLWGCKKSEKEYSNQPSSTLTAQITEPVSPPVADNAEAHYQQLIAQYGEKYQECLKPIKVKLEEVQKLGVAESPSLKQLNVIFALDAFGSIANTKNDVRAKLTPEIDRLSMCVTSKMNQEYVKIGSAVNGLSVSDRNYKYSNYVRRQLNERRAKIRAWRAQLADDVRNQRDVTADKLQRDLDKVTSNIKKR